MHSRALLLSLLIGCATTMACSSPKVVFCREVSQAEIAKSELGIDQWPAHLPDRSLSCAIGNYVVVVPSASSDVDHVMLFRNQQALFVRQGGVSAIFENGRPALDATDSDDDGAFDQVSYSVYGLDDWDEIRVRDTNLDAQPDMRIQHKPGRLEYWLWVENGWYETPSLGSKQVLVEGVPRAYDVVDGQHVFAPDKAEGRITTP